MLHYRISNKPGNCSDKENYRYVYLLTYFDPEPLAYVVDEAEMEKKVEMIVWHYKEWCKGIKINL